jgi:hypothetical protein
MKVAESFIYDVVEGGHNREKTFEDLIIPDHRELNMARKSASKKLLMLLVLILEQVDILCCLRKGVHWFLFL